MFRYPGTKRKISKIISEKIIRYYYDNDCLSTCCYVEPFIGTGAICLDLLQNINIKYFLINDRDIGISCLWNSILKYPKEICEYIRKFKPKVSSFFEFKEILEDNSLLKKMLEDEKNISYIGFLKVAVHQLSYSGLGLMAGGPIGGKEQKSKYSISDRWSPQKLIKKIQKYSNLFHQKTIINDECLCDDYVDIIKKSPSNSFFYFDPPYFEKGPELYYHSFSFEEHIRFRNILKQMEQPWMLSYDYVVDIKHLYSWAPQIEINLAYTINGPKHSKELLICSPKYKELLTESFNNDIFD